MGMTSFAGALIVITVMIMSHSIYGREFYDDEEIKVQQLLKKLNKSALKSIKSEDGDTIDCVPITSQPAFDHPLLKNHTIQMRPNFIPESDSTYTKEKMNAITQVWHKSGECPENTIPIRKVKKEDILRAKSIESFGKKTPPGILEVTSEDKLHHEYATMGVTSEKFFGTKASLSIWKPYVAPNEFSLAQTWLMSSEVGLSLNTIEAGWQVFPQIYGDNNPRLFIYWTSDEYKTTGCYNLLCQGFVQINQQYSVGGAYTTVSQYNGIQYDLNLHIFQDQVTKNWWLLINDNDVMGYRPGSLFISLERGATDVQWGGEVFVHDGVPHSTTDMGSGHFAEKGYGKTSYVRNLKTVDAKNILKEPVGLHSFLTNGNCYNFKKGNGTIFGNHFYYGGPGQNVKCP